MPQPATTAPGRRPARAKPPPNTLLEAARKRMPSPAGAPRPMSRQELAEAINQYLWTTYQTRDNLDRGDIGAYERGEIRWPSDRRREAFRAVLGVAHDHQLGFYTGKTPQPTMVPAAAARGGLGPSGDTLAAVDHRLAAPFLGRGEVTILVPVKAESIKNRPVVAVEDVTGSQRLSQLARQLGLTPALDYVPADGVADLNRENLLVVCGPRLSQPVAEVLAQDQALRFERHRRAWTVIDRLTGTRYRSGLDHDPPKNWDVGYLARLPRPDQQGSLIVLTGIHPPGTLGVIRFLRTELAALFAEVKTDSFSLLVGTHFDPLSREPRDVTPLTPIHRLETS
jgi:hypothetical protein